MHFNWNNWSKFGITVNLHKKNEAPTLTSRRPLAQNFRVMANKKLKSLKMIPMQNYCFMRT